MTATSETQAPSAPPKISVYQLRYILGQVVRYFLFVAIGFVFILPFLLAALGSFKTNSEIVAYPPRFLPAHWLVQNWVEVWQTDLGQGATFPRWLFNTAILSVTVAVLETIACSMAGYSFARLEFPGRNLVFTLMLGTMMIPGAVTLIPGYVLVTKLKLINTYWSLILPSITSAAAIFLLTQFFRGIPRELEEAAVIDGASHMQIYRTVVLPLARPALLTVFILQFQGMWNNFLTPLLYLNSPKMYVLNVALSIFQQQYKEQWNLILVGAMVNAVPILLLFFFFSRYYIESLSYAGLKG
jgi:multiple sugar transport system permease protein